MAEGFFDIHEEEEIGKVYDMNLLKRLLSYSKKYLKYFVLSWFLLTGVTVITLLRPYLMKIVIDDHLSYFTLNIGTNIDKTEHLRAIGIIGLIYTGLILIGFIMSYFQILVLSYAGQSIIYNIRNQVFTHIQKLSMSFFDKNPIGRLVTRVTNDTETLNEMYTNVIVTLLQDIIIVIGAGIIMYRMNSKLALIVLCALPIVVIATLMFRIKARQIYRKVRLTIAKVNSSLSENISGMRVIQLFKKEKENFREFHKTNDEYRKVSIREIVVFGIFRPSVELLATASIALILWFGGGEVISGAIEFGVLFAFVNYINMFFHPIMDFSEKYNIMQSSMASSERIFMILDKKPEEDSGLEMLPKENFQGSIEFKNVWFAYNNEEWVLKDVSFKVPKGETFAIVGATGSGKTTIMNLLCRFYEIQKGQILVDGIDIKNIKKSCLRTNIGIVLQDVFIFSDTVLENIRLNKKQISEEKVIESATYVNAMTFINDLKLKYNEIVSERGQTFSTGQRQLLAFARALAFDPGILILDEATSNIDTETEKLIQDALLKLTKNRTTIIIAHRLSTIKSSDNIILIHKGRITETGNHEELLAKQGMYHSLYSLQYI